MIAPAAASHRASPTFSLPTPSAAHACSQVWNFGRGRRLLWGRRMLQHLGLLRHRRPLLRPRALLQRRVRGWRHGNAATR